MASNMDSQGEKNKNGGGQKQACSCEYVRQILFSYYYLLIMVLFSKQTSIHLLLATLVQIYLIRWKESYILIT